MRRGLGLVMFLLLSAALQCNSKLKYINVLSFGNNMLSKGLVPSKDAFSGSLSNFPVHKALKNGSL